MKKIAIVTNKMNMGGCEKALISMLKNLEYNLYNITLFVREKGGILQGELPDYIKIKEIQLGQENINEIISYYYKNKKYEVLPQILYYRLIMKFSKKLYYPMYVNMLPKVQEEFDLAISYFFPGEFVDWYVLNNISASKKVVWIHSDIKKIDSIKNKTWKEMYKKYDHIVCVSNDVKEGFISYMPEGKNKLSVIYNCLNEKEILEKGNEKINFDGSFKGIKILTIGRLSKEKGQLQIPYILDKLLKNNVNAKWYCIGDGDLKQELQSEIKKYKLEERLILLGAKVNPYPYLKRCDIYVQPSIYEGYCISLAEAKIFNIPIVTTDFAGAREQIDNYETGIIVNANKDEIYDGLIKLINDDDLKIKFRTNLIYENINKNTKKFDILAKLT